MGSYQTTVKVNFTKREIVINLLGVIEGRIFNDFHSSPRTLSAKFLREITHQAASCIGSSFYNRQVNALLNKALEFYLQTLSVKFGGDYKPRTRTVKGLKAKWINDYRKLEIEERIMLIIPPEWLKGDSAEGGQENHLAI